MSGSERSSEIETVPPPRNSPLHQLMGYSSPSQVIRGIQSFGRGIVVPISLSSIGATGWPWCSNMYTGN
ncbi:hypothetical protein K1719_018123 [Acacia pycnantha]|nr:hypothetical protein K1719_018123 [Acacia pycnantha]